MPVSAAATHSLAQSLPRPVTQLYLAALALIAAFVLHTSPVCAAEARPIASVLRAGLERDGSNSDLYAWYAARNFAPAWTTSHGLTQNGRVALKTLAQVGNEGLPPARYGLPSGSATSQAQLASLDIAISRAVRQYIQDVRYGAANPHAPASSLASLSKAAGSKDLGQYFAAQRPQDPAYARLRGILTAARAKGDPASLARVQETILALEKMRWEHAAPGAQSGTNVALLDESLR